MGKDTILYVDDEVSNLQGFESIYFTEYNVLTATSGKQALEMLDDNEVHLIITDQKMPEMTGVEFLNQAFTKHPDPIRIILTGYSDIEVIIQAINSVGIYRYVTKPWDVQEMDMIIKQGLETFTLRRENKRLVEDLRKANEGLEAKVQERTEQVLEQKEEIEIKNEKITSSINYAKRIQDAMLPKVDFVKQYVDDAFVLFKPRDIVSGDFYWFNEYYGKTIIAVVDCTGHGVPGAFMSMVGSQALNNIVNIKHYDQPDLILSELHKEVKSLLNQQDGNNQDGMDVALCVIDNDRQMLSFSGAKNPLVYVKEGELEIIKGDKFSIGGIQNDQERSFHNHKILIDEPTTFYMFSDGYQDQFGGPEGRKFMIKRLKDLLLNIHNKPLNEQKIILEENINDWMKEHKQIDDILVVGFQVSFS